MSFGPTTFKSRGFYLHASWHFDYPFAVRTWRRSDYQGMFRLLRALGMDRVMLWPMMELAPPLLSEADARWLAGFRDVIEDAHALGLECWVVSSANLSTRPEIQSQPIQRRHFYPYKRVYRLDEPRDFAEFTSHLQALLNIINNADAYVFIDGDPGGYPGADPVDYVRLMHAARSIVDRVGVRPDKQKIVPWIWCGWGTDWESEGVWRPALRPLVQPVLHLLNQQPPAEPWELLPGRSIKETWANGRTNFVLAEEAGLIERSTLLTYEIIEFEPTPPAVVLQFDDIRRVLRQELPLADRARGIMGNAQQPIMALPNLYYFARCVQNSSYLDRSDEAVLADLADFLGGPADLLVPAWSCLQRQGDELPGDLPERLRLAKLSSEAAACLPGGPERYLDILAAFVRTRLAVLRACAEPPRSHAGCADRIAEATVELVRWWEQHHYVFSGEGASGFSWEYTNPLLYLQLIEWTRRYVVEPDLVLAQAAKRLASTGILTRTASQDLLAPLLRDELNPLVPGTYEHQVSP